MKYTFESDINKINRNAWTDFVMNHPDANIFQLPEMFNHYDRTPGYEPQIMAAMDASGRIIAILLASIIRDYRYLPAWFSARTIIYGGPIVDKTIEDTESLIDSLLSLLIKRVENKSLYIQFRNLFDIKPFDSLYIGHRFIFENHMNLEVNTSTPEIVYKNISKSKIRQAKKSLREGAEFVQATTEQEIDELYLILKNMYHKKVRKPLPNKSFFSSILQSSINNRLGIIFLVKFKGKIMSGMVCSITPGKVLHEWYICGLDKVNRKIHPSILVTYGAIQYAANNNIPRFDFMGIGYPDKPYGVRDFKMQFGGEVVNYGRYYRINNRFLFFIANAVFRFLALLKLV